MPNQDGISDERLIELWTASSEPGGMTYERAVRFARSVLLESHAESAAGRGEKEDHVNGGIKTENGAQAGEGSYEVWHDLKCWPHFFAALRRETKPFEVRKNDRNYRTGDCLRIREWTPAEMEYTGRELCRRVTYTLYGPAWGIEEGYVVMGVTPIGGPPCTDESPNTIPPRERSEAPPIFPNECCPNLTSCTCWSPPPPAGTEAEGGWIPWDGGECPIAEGVDHQVKFRAAGYIGRNCNAPSWGLCWEWSAGTRDDDIIAYRLVSPPPSPKPDPLDEKVSWRELIAQIHEYCDQQGSGFNQWKFLFSGFADALQRAAERRKP